MEKKLKIFPLLNTLKIPGRGSKLLETSFSHPPLSIKTRTIFFFSREYQTKLQSRIWNCYSQLPSLPVFSKIDSFCWLYKYKTESTTALKSCGKMYHQLWALLEQTSWPGSTEHSSGHDGFPGNSSPHVSILRQTFRRVKLRRARHFPRNQEVFSYLYFCIHCLLPCLTQTFVCVSCASVPRRFYLYLPPAYTCQQPYQVS